MQKPAAMIVGITLAVATAGGLFAANRIGQTARTPIASLFPMGDAFDFEPPVPGSYELHTIKSAPTGQVLDASGKLHDLSEIMTGKISLVSFVYLNCGDVNGCPLATSTLFDIYHSSIAAPVLHNNVQMLTISFDPERDTVEAIESFAYPIIHDVDVDEKVRWQVLTTPDQAALKPIIDGFGQVVDRSNDEERLNHLLRMFLVDRDGNIRNIYGLGLIDPRLMMTDIETLLIEDDTL